MADVVNRLTAEYRRSVNTPDYSPAQWVINPDLSLLIGVANKYWKVTGDLVEEMTPAEKAVVDAAEDADRVSANQQLVAGEPDSIESDGVRVRSLIQLMNKRDNYLVNRIIELQSALTALQASGGNAGSRIDALPAAYLPTQTRARADAVQDYKDDINAGVND